MWSMQTHLCPWTQGDKTADSPCETATLEASMPGPPCGSLDEFQTVGGDWSVVSRLPRPTAPWQYFSSWRTLHQLPSWAQLLPTALAYPLMCFLLLPSFKELCCSSTILHASPPFPIHFASNGAPPFHSLTNTPTIHQSHTKSEYCFPTQVLLDCPNRTEMGSAFLSLLTVSASYSS